MQTASTASTHDDMQLQGPSVFGVGQLAALQCSYSLARLVRVKSSELMQANTLDGACAVVHAACTLHQRKDTT
jgi:hypothetical protein